jgi:hypothetical protein
MSGLFVPFLLAAIGKATGIRPAEIAASVWRPLVAAAIMAVILAACMPSLPGPGAARLVAEVPLGMICYFAALLSLWHLAGRPPSPERDVVMFLRSLRSPLPERV